MKICISSKEKSLEGELDPRFGRCAYLIIYDTDSEEFEVIENPNITMAGGAGVQTAQLVISKGVKSVISGNFGPNAFNTLNAAGIEMYTDIQGKVIETINRFKNGKLQKIDVAGPSKKIQK